MDVIDGGAPGEQGIYGEQGVQGEQGIHGEQGRPGVNGTGIQGEPGPPGTDVNTTAVTALLSTFMHCFRLGQGFDQATGNSGIRFGVQLCY